MKSLTKTLIAFVFLVTGCQENIEQALRNRITNHSLHLMLRDETLTFDEIPKEIGTLSQLEELTITGTKGLTIFPPLTAVDFHTYRRDFQSIQELPAELLNLTSLKRLNLDIGLESLPTNLSRLTNLKSLNISFNPINLDLELPKIRQIPNLEELTVYGLTCDEEVLSTFAKETGIIVKFDISELVTRARQ